MTMLFFFSMPMRSEYRLDVFGKPTINNWSSSSSVRLEAEKILYQKNEDIAIRVKILNKGYKTVRIYPSPLPNQSFQFFLNDRYGREVKQEFDLASWENRVKGAKVINFQSQEEKEIILSPGEGFEKTIYLNDFYNLQANQEYRIWIYFSPGKWRGVGSWGKSQDRGQSNLFVRSENSLSVRVGKGKTSRGLHTFLKQQKNLTITPEETVYLFLSAEKQKKWINYLKYIDLGKYITSYNSYAIRFTNANRIDRDIILKEFSEFLTKDPAEKLTYFRILRSDPEKDKNGNMVPNGRYFVKVLGTRGNRDYLARYEYKYILEAQSEGLWKIIYVEAKFVR